MSKQYSKGLHPLQDHPHLAPTKASGMYRLYIYLTAKICLHLKENIILNDLRIMYQFLLKRTGIQVHILSAGIHQKFIQEGKTVRFLALFKQKDLRMKDHQKNFCQKTTNLSNNFFD